MKIEVIHCFPDEAQKVVQKFVDKVNVISMSVPSERLFNGGLGYTYHILYTDRENK